MDEAWINITKASLDPAAADHRLRNAYSGAVSLFVGTTRQYTEGRETIRLEYDAYEPMALSEMKRLASRCGEQWDVRRVAFLHRLGVVPIAEASVIVGVATPHRADAFDACRFLIDTLKEQVPIWKKEVYADGTTKWVEGAHPPSVEGKPSTQNKGDA